MNLPDPLDPLSLTDPDAEDPIDRPPSWVAKATRKFADLHKEHPQTGESFVTILAVLKSAEVENLPSPDVLVGPDGSVLLNWFADAAPGAPCAGRMVTMIASGRAVVIDVKQNAFAKFARPDLRSIPGDVGKLRVALDWVFPGCCGGHASWNLPGDWAGWAEDAWDAIKARSWKGVSRG